MANHAARAARWCAAHHSNLLTGKVTCIGYYGDTLPKLVVTISKKSLEPLSLSPGMCHPASLSVSGDLYRAALRTSDLSATVMFCPDLLHESGEAVRWSIFCRKWD